jgi:5S rRNA maturation endonuclease (ribonuclease M5)
VDISTEKQEFEEWIRELIENDITIIVEGRKDRAALKKLGVENIIILNKPLYKISEALAQNEKQAIILTDLDSEGKKLYAKLNHELCQLGIHVDNGFRQFLFRKTKLRQIEGMDSYIQRL